MEKLASELTTGACFHASIRARPYAMRGIHFLISFSVDFFNFSDSDDEALA
jgi:hypothetical protein